MTDITKKLKHQWYGLGQQMDVMQMFGTRAINKAYHPNKLTTNSFSYKIK